MTQAFIVNYEYIPSETIETRGKRNEIRSRYPGYKVKVEKNGYWILTKTAKLEVTLRWGNGRVETFNMRSEILDLYGKKKATERLLETFVKDVEKGKREIWMDDYSCYTIL